MYNWALCWFDDISKLDYFTCLKGVQFEKLTIGRVKCKNALDFSGYRDRKITGGSYDQTPYWLLGKSNTGSSSPVRSRTWHLTKFNLIRSNLTKLGQIRSNVRIQPALAQAQLNQDQPDLTCSSLHLGLARLKPSSPHIELRLFRILRSHWDCNKRGLVK